jgi:cytosine permease
LLGTVLGLGLYQYFLDYINFLAALVPPLIGPLIVDYYFVHKKNYDPADLKRLHLWNIPAISSYAVGAFFAYGATYKVMYFDLLPEIFIPSLLGLVVSMATYFLIYIFSSITNTKFGYSSVRPQDTKF